MITIKITNPDLYNNEVINVEIAIVNSTKSDKFGKLQSFDGHVNIKKISKSERELYITGEFVRQEYENKLGFIFVFANEN